MPIVIVFLVLGILPLMQTFYFSLTDFNGINPNMHFVGLQNYRDVLNSGQLTDGLYFTLLFAIAHTILTTVLAIPLAVVLNKKFFGRNFARSVFFFLGVPSMAILGLVWRYIFSPLSSGALNHALATFGIGPQPWLADATMAQWCIIFVSVWAGVGWHATLYIAYLQAIPGDLYEQAQVDGASSRQQFFHITLPQLIPAIVVSTFLLMTGGLKVYDMPYAMTKGGPGFATNTVTQSIVDQGIAQAQYGIGSALVVMFTLASLLVVLLQMLAARAVSRRFA
ncbi:ABC transporter permease [Boudabousia liubingyangii]|uniref:ABC transporter permease n=1 Tax=Boudabousia liubingyangii TaxID=1921764 RepID=A0A1Q5PQI4_9ACTO|nr:sugar ABC transporter permease [Boudabousia liubingyangii]OKL48206.1 ABC transporter permease [Boudabousia liubingyangii]OKL49881.1 ABC transporter permease [Boudabousia liubingyangii]